MGVGSAALLAARITSFQPFGWSFSNEMRGESRLLSISLALVGDLAELCDGELEEVTFKRHMTE
jgi:hypothetical protein